MTCNVFGGTLNLALSIYHTAAATSSSDFVSELLVVSDFCGVVVSRSICQHHWYKSSYNNPSGFIGSQSQLGPGLLCGDRGKLAS